MKRTTLVAMVVLVFAAGVPGPAFGAQSGMDGRGRAAVDQVEEPAPALVNEVCWWRSCIVESPNAPGKAAEIAQRDTPGWATARSAPWVEIFNSSPAALNLGGWQLVDGDGRTMAELPAWTLPAGAYLVVAFGPGHDDPDGSDGRAVF